jgi:hypothetical protein
MSGYSLGRAIEYAVIDDLKDNGYVCTRAASSKGAADVIGIKAGQVILVSVKRTTPPGPAERAALVGVARMLPGVGVPLVALGPASKLTYRRLTGVGAKAWEPCTPDEVAA